MFPSPPTPVKRHALLTRLWHWVNVIALAVLVMSGLNIFNAHPRLYWGSFGSWDDPAWLELARFPHWLTIPGYYSLADARLWHLFFAWVFAVAFALFLIGSLVNRHIVRDLHIRRAEWHPSLIIADIRKHFGGQFTDDERTYNPVQRMVYAGVVLGLIPLMIFTGLAMSPAMAANWPWLLDIFGGRQSARSLHFIGCWLLVGFTLLHIIMVMLSGPAAQLRGMILGGRRTA